MGTRGTGGIVNHEACHQTLVEAQAEIERLQAALEELRELAKHTTNFRGFRGLTSELVEHIARQALEERTT
jgi:hypothetical protein